MTLGQKGRMPHGELDTFHLGLVAVPFEVYPLNVHEMNHTTGSDWSKKEIVGAALYREWVGENDEEIIMRGRLFPHFFGRQAQLKHGVSGPQPASPANVPGSGLSDIDVLNNMRALGQAHALVRGDGWHFGWFVIDHMSRGHTSIGREGIGQQIQFEISFQRVPVPEDPNVYFPMLFGATQGG